MNWDGWRQSYDRLTFQDQKDFYRDCAVLYPCQQHFDLEAAREFFDRYRPRTVLELGGWDGALASQILADHDEILCWRNHDLVAVPQIPTDPRYELNELFEPLWEGRGYLYADAFVATHTIEHVKARELGRLVAKLHVKACLIEAPLDDSPLDWRGYDGTHVLELGWEGVDALFGTYGYETERSDHVRFYVKTPE